MAGAACVPRAADLPFGGVCPATELTCPPCPRTSPVKCPSGGCADVPNQCTPNVLFRNCNETVCREVQWCHVLPRMPYACWEQAPSSQTAHIVFESIDEGRCGTCNHIVSRYHCSSCCGSRAVATWESTYRTPAPDRLGGGVFMQGSRWVCMLRAVAAGLELGNAASGLEAPAPTLPPLPSPPPPSPPPPPAADAAYTFPMPAEYDLE